MEPSFTRRTVSVLSVAERNTVSPASVRTTSPETPLRRAGDGWLASIRHPSALFMFCTAPIALSLGFLFWFLLSAANLASSVSMAGVSATGANCSTTEGIFWKDENHFVFCSGVRSGAASISRRTDSTFPKTCSEVIFPLMKFFTISRDSLM